MPGQLSSRASASVQCSPPTSFCVAWCPRGLPEQLQSGSSACRCTRTTLSYPAYGRRAAALNVGIACVKANLQTCLEHAIQPWQHEPLWPVQTHVGMLMELTRKGCSSAVRDLASQHPAQTCTLVSTQVRHISLQQMGCRPAWGRLCADDTLSCGQRAQGLLTWLWCLGGLSCHCAPAAVASLYPPRPDPHGALQTSPAAAACAICVSCCCPQPCACLAHP